VIILADEVILVLGLGRPEGNEEIAEVKRQN
jgi:hypothetical protein